MISRRTSIEDEQPSAGARPARITSLDGLRGLAASSVLATHAIGALAKSPEQTIALIQSPVSIIANGGGGVNLFFVLSGYCLAGPAGRAMSRVGISQYFVRRILRIHLPFVIALLLTWLASRYLYTIEPSTAGMSNDVVGARGLTISLEQLGRSLLFPGRAFGLFPVGWTLHVEMIYSLLMPFMIWLVIRSHWTLLVVLSLVVLFLDWTTLPFKHYAIDFSVGFAIYYERERLEAFFARIRGWRAHALLMTGWVIMALPSILLIAGRYQRVSILLFSSGSMILVAGAIHHHGFRSFLSGPLVGWLGRISYSVYLIHYPIIIFLSGFVLEPVGFIGGVAFVLACLAVTLPVAELLYRVAEKPAIELGYAASNKLSALARESRA